MKIKTLYAGLFVLALLAVSCQDQEKTGTDKSTQEKKWKSNKTEEPELADTTLFSVKVEKVGIQEMDIAEKYTANINAWEEANVGPAQPNQIEKIYVEVGDRVKKGDLLAQMDQASLIAAKIQHEDAKLNFERMDTLIAYGSISQQVYDKTKMAFELSKSALQTLQENVFLTAPFDGLVTGKYFNDGEIYSGMAPNPMTGVACIVSLVQIDQLKVFINVSETYWPLIKKGMKASLASDIYPGEKFPGTVYRIYPTINPSTKTFQVEVKIPNPSEKLRPGMYAKINLEFGAQEALIIPSSALLKQEGTNQKYVFVEKDGIAEKKIVNTGRRYNDLVEIKSGLEAGENLIVAGQAKLMEGNMVEVVTE